MIKSLIASIFLTLFFNFFIASTVQASIISISKDGEITWKVLSEQDAFGVDIPTHSYIEVKKVADEETTSNSSVELSKSGDKISLFVTNNNESRKVNITDSESNLIEVEERPEIQKINIGYREGKFSLQQRGIVALTDFPIKIDSQTANLTVGTGSGDKFLSVLPYQIVQNVLRSKLITRVTDNRLEIIEEDRELRYSFSGEKVFDIFGFFEYKIPVSMKVSASTGETISIEGPTWYRVIGFFLS
jgi:hypothetical protein